MVEHSRRVLAYAHLQVPFSSARPYRLRNHHATADMAMSSTSSVITRLRIVADPPRREEEQRDQPAPAALRVVVTPRVRARPPGPLPAVQAPELGAVVDGHDAVDLAVRVGVVLALEVVLAVDGRHVHGGHGAVARGLGRRRHARAAVARAVDGDVGDPALVEAEPDEAREGVVVLGSRAVVCVEVVLEGLAWGARVSL